MTIVQSPPALVCPVKLLEDALGWCQIRGITVRVGDYGIVHTGIRWVLAPGTDGVCPLGAVVLMVQPPVTTLPEAAPVALDTHLAYCEGIAAGLERRALSNGWMQTPRWRLYREGFAVGEAFRMASMLITCRCGCRHTRGEPCPHCEILLINAMDNEDC